MKRIVLSIAFALSMPAAAHADFASRTTCGRTYMGKYECSSVVSRGPQYTGPVELRTPQEIKDEEDRWIAYCQPKRGAPDEYGVVRMIYAHKGCEFGATGPR